MKKPENGQRPLPTVSEKSNGGGAPPTIRDVYIRNYKSFADATVPLGPFTVFVGRNGSGKSNFVEALSFLQQSLSESIELAFKNRGGINAVRRRSGGHPTNIGIRLGLDLRRGMTAEYAFEVAAKPKQDFRVSRERCIVWAFPDRCHEFEVANGEFRRGIPGIRPRVTPDRLALFAASATDEFRPVYDFLTGIRTYSIVPEQLRHLQDADAGDVFRRDGGNAAAVLKRLRTAPGGAEKYERICRLLGKVAGGIQRVDYKPVGQKETLSFRQDVGLKDPWTFDALNMSDGTLRVLGLFLALYQTGSSSVVVIEEPESTIHPAVAELVMQVLMDASADKQVIVTTHSPDALDFKGLSDGMIRIVRMERGRSLIAPLAQSTRRAIREHLYSPGDLLRTDEINPDIEAAESQTSQLALFPEAGDGASFAR